MSFLPFLSAFFLIITPGLLWVNNKLELNPEKLKFWIMVLSGTSWLLSLIFFLTSPETRLNPIWDAGEALLPSLAFSLDWVSSSLILALNSLIFVGVLVGNYSPQTSAWITALGGICGIGLLSDSAYTLALVWTIIESFHLIVSLKNQTEQEGSRYIIMGIVFRLTGPLLIITISLVNVGMGGSQFLTEFDSTAGSYLLIAGLIGFSGWFLFPRNGDKKESMLTPGRYASLIPATLGLMLITRSAVIITSTSFSALTLFLLGAVVFLISLLGFLFNLTEKTWGIGLIGLIIGSALIADPKATLSWGVLYLLPGLLFLQELNTRKNHLIALILGGIGILPLPFFPAWLGVAIFAEGLPGLLFALSTGLILGAMLNQGIRYWRVQRLRSEPAFLMLIIGSALLILSQLIISLQSGFLVVSLESFSYPVTIWIAGPLTLVVALFGDRVPRLKMSGLGVSSGEFMKTLSTISSVGATLFDQAVYLITRLFEGDGGLIWALLIGFLIITLISLSGG